MKSPGNRLYGVAAMFSERTSLEKTVQHLRVSGLQRIDVFAPSPEGLPQLVGARGSLVPLFVLLGGITGGTTGYLFQLWALGPAYPLNIGGRPLHSWPLFIPVTFELTVLGAALSGLISMLLLNGLPRLHHPIFDVPGFERVSTDSYCLLVLASDPAFETVNWREILKECQPDNVTEIHQDPVARHGEIAQ
jgi:Protein of unknown function (DUF3341)